MTGWAATNTLREALDAEYDGFCAWCQCPVHEQPHASECEGRRALAKLALVETALDSAEPMANLPWPLSADERQEWIVAQNRLLDALRAVREGA